MLCKFLPEAIQYLLIACLLFSQGALQRSLADRQSTSRFFNGALARGQHLQQDTPNPQRHRGAFIEIGKSALQESLEVLPTSQRFQ